MTRGRRLRYVPLAALSMLLLAGNAECENVETCSPTRVTLTHEGGGAYAVTVRSGEQPLRGVEVRVQAAARDRATFTRDVEVDDDGEAVVRIPADDLGAASEIVAAYPGNRTFCPSGDGTDGGTGGGTG